MTKFTFGIITNDGINLINENENSDFFEKNKKVIEYFKNEVLLKELPNNENILIMCFPNGKFEVVVRDSINNQLRKFTCD